MVCGDVTPDRLVRAVVAEERRLDHHLQRNCLRGDDAGEQEQASAHDGS